MRAVTFKIPPVLVALALALPTGARGQDPSLEEWRQDLAFLVETLEDVHPSLFHRVGRDEFMSAVTRLEQQLPTLESYEIPVELMRIAALAHDGHTALVPAAGSKWIPLRFDRLAGRTYVIATDEAHAEWLGHEVSRLGGIDVDEVWDRVLAISPGENNWSKLFNGQLTLSRAGRLQGLGVGDGASLAVEFADDVGGGTVSVTEWTGGGDLGHWLFDKGGAPGGSGPRLASNAEDAGTLSSRRDDPYWAEWDGDLLYVRADQVLNSDRAVWVAGETRRLTLPQFWDAVLRITDDRMPEKLVFDLRRNDGGNNFLARSLPRGIAARPRLNQRGKIFVLTGRHTYSAAMNLVSMLEDQTEAIFVGEPPGGSPRHYGDARSFTLPNSRMRLRVSTLMWDLGVAPDDVRQFMEPDIWAEPTIEALREGRDDAMEAVRVYKTGQDGPRRSRTVEDDQSS